MQAMTTLDIQIEDSNADETQQLGTEGRSPDGPRHPKEDSQDHDFRGGGADDCHRGLISDTKNLGSRGIPFLSKIPVIGGFFGRQSNINIKSETILLMTPHTISDQTKARTVTGRISK